MSKRKHPRGKKNHQKKHSYPKKKNNINQENALRGMAVKINQLEYAIKKNYTRIEGIVYAFDRYLKMNGDSEKLNKLIQEEFKQNKKQQETKSVESDRSDSKGPEQK